MMSNITLLVQPVLKLGSTFRQLQRPRLSRDFLLQHDDLHQEHQLYSCSCYYAAKDLSSVVYVHHHSLVVPSQYSDLTSGTTQLSSGSHTTTAADFFAVIFLPLYNLCPPCSIFFFMLICNSPTSPLNTLLL